MCTRIAAGTAFTLYAQSLINGDDFSAYQFALYKHVSLFFEGFFFSPSTPLNVAACSGGEEAKKKMFAKSSLDGERGADKERNISHPGN